MREQDYYNAGFQARCKEYGADPALVKQAAEFSGLARSLARARKLNVGGRRSELQRLSEHLNSQRENIGYFGRKLKALPKVSPEADRIRRLIGDMQENMRYVKPEFLASESNAGLRNFMS